jgi:hypothetical protein
MWQIRIAILGLSVSMVAIGPVVEAGCGRTDVERAAACDAGTGPALLGVRCGDLLCSPPTPVCCPAVTDPSPPRRALSGTCVASADACAPELDSQGRVLWYRAYECDDSADCRPGNVCCNNFDTISALCRTGCLESTTGEAQLCGVDCECGSGSNACLMADAGSDAGSGYCCRPSGALCTGSAECCSKSCDFTQPRGTLRFCQ